MGRWNYHLMGSDYAQDEFGELITEIFLEYFPNEDLEDIWEILNTEGARKVFHTNAKDIVQNYYSFALPFFLMNMGIRIPSDLYPMLIEMTKHSIEYQFNDIDKTYEEYLKYFISDEFTDEQLLQMIEKENKEFNENLAKTLGRKKIENLNISQHNLLDVLLDEEEIEDDYEEDDDFDDDDFYEFEEENEDDEDDFNLFNWQESNE
jgi:hypothetical protein